MNSLAVLREALIDYENELNQALMDDLESPYETSICEYGLALQQISLVERRLKGWMKPVTKEAGSTGLPGKAHELAKPYGNALIISPWNDPIALTIQPLIGSITAGNKPSELSPHTSAVLVKLLSRTFPEGYVAAVQGGREESEALMEQRFDSIFFTGSTAVGRSIMEKAAHHLTPATLELGGKSPCVVRTEADLWSAAKNVAHGKMMNSGQICVAPDYALVDGKAAEKFCKELTQQCRKMVGDTLTNPKYPRIISHRRFERLQGLMEGVTVRSGG